LQSVTPEDEANRVFQNCRMTCLGEEAFFCPDGRKVKNGTKC
jgi:hypothetical protein